MRHAAALWAALAGASFWEAKPPAEWSKEELAELLSDSPWARPAIAERGIPAGGVQTFLPNARPIQEALAERKRRGKKQGGEETEPEPDDYEEFLQEHADRSIVLAVAFPDFNQLADAKEAARMERDCVMRVGKRKHRLLGHFPPTPRDPYLRLVFPRDVTPRDKKITFELYLPGVISPFRETEYVVKELLYRGKLEL